ncbi:hypothetical protein BaRGS_00008045 [Batillaria attramentaria]|uniref:Uncharacterized protein n=1 Tax=Batillaria attramentaria TaxID=370345 RepID=A0ABD0LMX0_9CAEN
MLHHSLINVSTLSQAARRETNMGVLLPTRHGRVIILAAPAHGFTWSKTRAYRTPGRQWSGFGIKATFYRQTIICLSTGLNSLGEVLVLADAAGLQAESESERVPV